MDKGGDCVHKLNAFVDSLPGNRADNMVAVLFALSACLPPYVAAIPGAWMLVRIATDKGLRQKMWSMPFAKALIGFCLILLISTLRFGDAMSLVVCVGILAAMAALLYLRAVVTQQILLLLLRGALWSAIASLALAVAQVLRYDWAGGYRPDSFYFNPNCYSMICGFMLVSALYQWMRRLAPRPLILTAMAACAVGLWLSNSRTGMASALLGSLLLILFMKSKKGAMLVVSGVTLACAALLLFPNLLRLSDLGASLGIRTGLWEAAFFGIAQRPIFGQGAWAFARISSGFPLMGEIHAHNLLLELVLSAGLAGTVLLLLYLFGSVRGVYRATRNKSDGGLAPLCFSIFSMAMFHGMTDLVVFAPHNAVFLMLLLGLAGLDNRNKPGEKQTQGSLTATLSGE